MFFKHTLSRASSAGGLDNVRMTIEEAMYESFAGENAHPSALPYHVSLISKKSHCCGQICVLIVQMDAIQFGIQVCDLSTLSFHDIFVWDSIYRKRTKILKQRANGIEEMRHLIPILTVRMMTSSKQQVLDKIVGKKN